MDYVAAKQVVEKIISGGQSGVDRGALDAALALDMPHGGWCPRGRQAEDGRIADRYQLRECQSKEYWVRTEQNVVTSTGTLILHTVERLTGGTLFTLRMAKKHRKPYFLVNLSEGPCAQEVQQWICQNGISILNVAGPRQSSSPGVDYVARRFVVSIFADEIV